MTLKSLIRKQKPLTVSLISFLLMLSIVIVIGLIGGRHIISYLQTQLVEHGIAHNEEVINGMRPLLERSLEDGVEPAKVVAGFQQFAEHAQPFGVRLFLLDLTRGRVLADSRQPRAMPYPVQQLTTTPIYRFDGSVIKTAEKWNGTVWRKTASGAIELLTLHPLQTPSSVTAHWALGVSSDLSELLLFMDELHLHLDIVLLITYGLIGLLGFMVLRWVGRRYESGLEQQVAARTRDLEAAHRKLLDQTRLATIGQTASVLAHEMRNPMASIKLALSSVSRNQELPQREKQRLDLVLGEVDRLENLLSETLEYVRPIVRDEQPCSLDELLDRVLELEQPMLKEKKLLLKRESCPDCPKIWLDSRKMQQVLLNVLKNAREASVEGGTVGLTLYHQENCLRLRVTNQGSPLSAEVKAQAFEFFFTTKARGTGLGLGLVKRVVEEHGGTVELHGDDHGQTQIELCLPID